MKWYWKYLDEVEPFPHSPIGLKPLSAGGVSKLCYMWSYQVGMCSDSFYG